MSLSAWRVIASQIRGVHSLTALRKALRLFRTGAHSNDESKSSSDSFTALHLASSPLYTDVLHFALTTIPATFTHHLPSHKGPLSSHPRFKVIGPLLKSYLTSYVHLLTSLHDPQMTRLMLSSLLSTLTPLFDPFHKLAHRLLRHLITLWSTADRSTRIDAFLCIRHMALTLPRHDVLEEAMKGLYLTYVQYAKWVSAVNVGVLEFMCNCVVELYGMDVTLAYQHAFVYIRQLAIHLRNAQQNSKGGGGGKKGGEAGQGKKGKGRGKVEEGYRLVYQWQFINCLRLFTKLLSSPLACHPVSASSPATPTLRPLLYPFVQICVGVMGLLPSSRYHPLRLIVSEYLLTLSSSCHLFIPVLPTLLSIFSSAELTRRPSSSSSRAPDLRYLLRASKATLSSRGYQEALCTRTLHLMTRYCVIHSYGLGYCELVLPVLRGLKRWVKGSKIGRLRKEIGGVITQLEWNAEWSRKKREASDWTPKDALEGRVDAMMAFKGVGGEGGKDAISPLERYAGMDREGGGKEDVDEKDMDWDGSKSKGKRRGGGDDDDDEEEDDEDDEKGEDGEDVEEDGDDIEGDGMMDVDEDDDDDEEEEEEEVDERKQAPARSGKKQQQSAHSGPVKAKGKAGELKGKGKVKEKKKQRGSLDEDGIGGSEDVVTELVLSDDE